LPRKIAFETLGCRLNQSESDSLSAQFIEGGWNVVDFKDQADVYVVNTCTVTNKADRTSRNTLGGPARRSPNAVVIATGCFVGSAREFFEQRQDVTYVVENAKKSGIFALVDAHFKGEIIPPDKLPSDLFAFTNGPRLLHTRAHIKIQDGCDNFCSFCIIPHVRGPAKSRPLSDILEEIQHTLALGYREIILTGVNISRYQDENTNFEALLETILQIPGDHRFRIPSIEPENLGERFLNLIGHPRLCPHLHLCLQSGSPRILLSMRREYTLENYRNLVQEIRKRSPAFSITTDVITGFPGESLDDLEATARAIREFGYLQTHVFKYSRREGTEADSMPFQIDEAEKTRRSQYLHQVGQEIQKREYELLLGQTQTVLVESFPSPGWAKGIGENYPPIRFYHPEALRGDFYMVKIIEVDTRGETLHLVGERITL